MQKQSLQQSSTHCGESTPLPLDTRLVSIRLSSKLSPWELVFGNSSLLCSYTHMISIVLQKTKLKETVNRKEAYNKRLTSMILIKFTIKAYNRRLTSILIKYLNLIHLKFRIEGQHVTMRCS